MNLTSILPIAIAVVLVGVLWLARSASKSGTSSSAVDANERDNPSNWIGPIYNNPKDPNLFVPKRLGMGTTVNFAHPAGKLILIVPLALAILLLLRSLLFH